MAVNSSVFAFRALMEVSKVGTFSDSHFCVEEPKSVRALLSPAETGGETR